MENYTLPDRHTLEDFPAAFLAREFEGEIQAVYELRDGKIIELDQELNEREVIITIKAKDV